MKKLLTYRQDINRFDYFCQNKRSLMSSFGEIIKTERERKKLFLRQVAAGLEIDQALISKFEKGDRKPTKDQVEKFADFFNLNKNDLLTAWLSDKIIYTIQGEENAMAALRIAENIIKYERTQK